MAHSYMYKCVITKPKGREKTLQCFGLKELTDALNKHLAEAVGLEGFFTTAKLQNIVNGRTKTPSYMKHWRIEREELFHNGFW